MDEGVGKPYCSVVRSNSEDGEGENEGEDEFPDKGFEIRGRTRIVPS